MIGYIIGIVFGSLALLLGAIFLFIKWKESVSTNRRIKEIGKSAELQVNADIKIWAKKTNNKFLPASLYGYGKNKVFEVDGILITSKALVVIEIKSIKGGIKGDVNSRTWEKVLGEKTHQISNPVFQNEMHIEHIIKMTDIKVPTISLIVFSNRVHFIDVTDTPAHVIITKHSNLFNTLDDIDNSLPLKMSDYDIKNLSNKIASFKAKRRDIQLHKKITKGRK